MARVKDGAEAEAKERADGEFLADIRASIEAERSERERTKL